MMLDEDQPKIHFYGIEKVKMQSKQLILKKYKQFCFLMMKVIKSFAFWNYSKTLILIQKHFKIPAFF